MTDSPRPRPPELNAVETIERERDRLVAGLLRERAALGTRMTEIESALARLARHVAKRNEKELRLDHDGFPDGQSGRLVSAILEEPGISTADLMIEASIRARAYGSRNLSRLERNGWIIGETIAAQGNPKHWRPTSLAKEFRR